MREEQQANHQKQYEGALARMEVKKEYLELYEEEKIRKQLHNRQKRLLIRLW